MQRPRLLYRAGNEHNPSNPFGRCELAIAPEGAARLDHHARGGVHRSWSGQVAAAVIDRLWAALDRAGFPATPPHEVPASATIRTLVAEVDGTSEGVHIEWFAAAELPGFDEAFAILDALVRQLSEDTLQHTPAGEPGMVSDVTPIL